MSGWVKLHRDIFESDIWHDATTFRLFVLLIGKATHQDGVMVNGLELKRGQYLRSYRKLAEDLAYKEGRGTKKYSLSTIKRCINKLVKSERVSILETELGTLFTVLNYSKYQDFSGGEEETQNGSPNEPRTNPERPQNNNKNEKKEKNEKNINSIQSEVFSFYENNIGVIGSFIGEKLGQWMDDLSPDVVLEALKKTIAANARTWSYVESILRQWASQNVKTVNDVQALEMEFKSKQLEKKQTGRRNPRKGPMPDYLKEPENTTEKPPTSPEVEEANQRWLEGLLKEI